MTKTIAAHVREIVDQSEIALDALRDGILNLSAYAKKILPEISRRSKRQISHGSIVVALCRYEMEVKKKSPIYPRISIESISTRTALSEITFIKSSSNSTRLRSLQENPKLAAGDVFTIVSGIREISLIVPSTLAGEVLKVFKAELPILTLDKLASITLRFPAKYLHKPNTTFALLRPLALHRINIIEVVSTYTEFTIILSEKDLNLAFAIFNGLPTTTNT